MGPRSAVSVPSKPVRAWVPSQKGLLLEPPQRHRKKRCGALRAIPRVSVTSRPPSHRYGPFFVTRMVRCGSVLKTRLLSKPSVVAFRNAGRAWSNGAGERAGSEVLQELRGVATSDQVCRPTTQHARHPARDGREIRRRRLARYRERPASATGWRMAPIAPYHRRAAKGKGLSESR